MTDIDKAYKFDALQKIKNSIEGCFGISDKIFAKHPTDQERASEMVNTAKNADISREEIEDIALAFLYRVPCSMEHIREQMDAIHEFLKKEKM